MAIENIQDGWHGHTKKEVREALQNALHDLQEHGVGSSVVVNDTLGSTSKEEALSANQGRKLKEMIDSKAGLMPNTDRIDHSESAAVVLASMGSELDGSGGYRPSDGDYYATPSTIRFRESEGNIVEMLPDERLIYCNARTNKLYRWAPTSGGGVSGPHWQEVGEDEARATINTVLGMLSPEQWPRVVIESLNPSTPKVDGLVYIAATSGNRPEKLVVKVGTYQFQFDPSPHVIYCVKDEAALYLYVDGYFEPLDYYRKDEVYSKEETQQYVQQHGGGGGSNVSIVGTSLVLGKSNSPGVNPGTGTQEVIRVYHVDPAEHNITEGMFNKSGGHYSASQYKKMYDNAVGFTRAFEDAHRNGYTKVVIPKGDYCFTPIFMAGQDEYPISNIPPCVWILNMSDLEIDMNGSTFHLLVDSTEHSDYYKALSTGANSLPLNDYRCTLIGIGQAKNITIKNGNFRGDIFSRNYSSGSEATREGCYGITVGVSAFTHNISLLDLDGSGFSGDFIKTQPRMLYIFKQPFWNGLYNEYNDDVKMLPSTTVKGVMNYGYGFGYNESVEIVTQNNGSSNKFGLSGIHDIGNWFTDTDYDDYEYVSEEASRREYSLHTIGSGYRLANCYAPLINVLTYAEYPSSPDTPPLRIIKTGYCESFQLFGYERYVRLQFLHEDGLTTGHYRSTGLSDLSAVNTYFGTSFTAADVSGDNTNAPNQAADVAETLDDPEDGSIPMNGSNSCTVAVSDAGGAGPRVAIYTKLNDMVLIEGCRIHDNGRGGVEGGANNVVIRRCEFMKQQYSNTSAAQGTHPVFSVSGTNYHIDYEDHVSNHVTIEHCVFYSGKSTGKLLFPTVMRFDFRDNICYGCTPCIGNNFITNIEGNTFYGTSISPYYQWLTGTQCSSRSKMMRVMNYVNNVYHSASSPGYGVLINTIQNIRNCSIEIDSSYNTEFESSKEFMSGSRPTQVFDGCTIRFMSPNTAAYFPHLKNCHIYGGANWKVGLIEDCVLHGSVFAIIGSFNDAGEDALHLHVRNVRGLDLRSHCHPPLTIHRNKTNGEVTDPKLDYIVHYEDCEIDVSRVFEQLLAYTRSSNPARWYKDIILEFKDCRFTGSASSTDLEASGSTDDGAHYSRVVFSGCTFDLDTAYLFGGSAGVTNRYFEFDRCTFAQAGFKLGSSGDYQLVCGGDYGTTANRPMLTRAGSVYFDTDEGKPLWRSTGNVTVAEIVSDGVEYVDATGTEA